MCMAKVSIVIPAYNAEKYINNCLESIEKQTYSDIEIIVVNDGSTDNTEQMVLERKNNDSRIILINQNNAGTGFARKKGIEIASGDYITFVDSDDWIESCAIQILMEKAHEYEADIVFSGLIRENRNLISVKKESTVEKSYGAEDMDDFYRYLFKQEDEDGTGIFLSVCSKLIRTGIIKEVVKKYNEKITRMEDTAVLIGCCVLSEKNAVLTDSFYHYCMRENSATHSYDINFLEDINKVYHFVNNCIEEKKDNDSFREGWNVFWVEQCIRGLSLYYPLAEKARFPYYIFETGDIPKYSKIVLYGAGRVGKSYYKQFASEKTFNIVAWVDENEKLEGIEAIDVIKEREWDVIIIAMKFKSMAEQVKEKLVSVYGVDANKVIWKKPQSLIEKYMGQ